MTDSSDTLTTPTMSPPGDSPTNEPKSDVKSVDSSFDDTVQEILETYEEIYEYLSSISDFSYRAHNDPEINVSELYSVRKYRRYLLFDRNLSQNPTELEWAEKDVRKFFESRRGQQDLPDRKLSAELVRDMAFEAHHELFEIAKRYKWDWQLLEQAEELWKLGREAVQELKFSEVKARA